MKKIIFYSLFIIFSFGTAFSQTEKPIYEIHAAMIFNFMKYIQWPDDGGADFIVGVLGEDDVFNTLKNYYDGKPKGTKKYLIRKLANASEATTCQVVYIGKNKSKEFDN